MTPTPPQRNLAGSARPPNPEEDGRQGGQQDPSPGATPARSTTAGRPERAASSAEGAPDPRPLGGYAVLVSTYGSLALALGLGLRKKRDQVRALSSMDLVLLGLATEHLSRLITKDSVTAVIRAPFTRFEEPAGEGESNEEVVGTGVRHAVGELLTCPFCAAQWVATGLVAGRVMAPRATTALINVCAAARVSDYLQLAYGWLRSVGS